MSRPAITSVLGACLAAATALVLLPATSTATPGGTTTSATAFAGKPGGKTLATAHAHSRCLGGGQVGLIVEQTAPRVYDVTVQGRRMDDGTRWRGEVAALGSRTMQFESFDFVVRAADGRWSRGGTITMRRLDLFIVTAEGPGRRFCLLANTPDRPAFAVSFCRNRMLAVLTAVERPRLGHTKVRYTAGEVRPGSRWQMRLRAADRNSAQSVTVRDTASKQRVVHAVGTVSGFDDPRLHATATGPRGQRCGIGFRHTELGDGELMSGREAHRLVEDVRHARRQMRRDG